MKDTNKLKEVINEIFDTFSYEGELCIYKDEELLIEKRNSGLSPVFPISKYEDAFVHILLIKALQDFNIDFNDTIDKYFPNLINAKKISFLNILKDETGLVDLYGVFSNEYQNTKDYQNLSEQEKIEYDINFFLKMFSEEEVIEAYNKRQLDHQPGACFDYSQICQSLGIFLVEKLFQKPYDILLDEYIFKPFKIVPKKVNSEIKRYRNVYPNNKLELNIKNDNLFIGLTTTDIYKIYKGLTDGEIVNLGNLKLMQKLTPFNGISFSESYSFAHNFITTPFNVFEFKQIDVIVIKATNFGGYDKTINGEAYNFDNYFMQEIAPYFLEYYRPKLVKLNKKNVYDLLYIQNDLSQLWFMGPTKYMLAYQYTEPKVTCYLLMDHGVAVGTVCLYIDKKGQKFDIANVLIDKKYQGRGYGKALIRESIKVFKKHGAKVLTIFVVKANERAFKTYLGCGFKIKASFPQSYELEYFFD